MVLATKIDMAELSHLRGQYRRHRLRLVHPASRVPDDRNGEDRSDLSLGPLCVRRVEMIFQMLSAILLGIGLWYCVQNFCRLKALPRDRRDKWREWSSSEP